MAGTYFYVAYSSMSKTNKPTLRKFPSRQDLMEYIEKEVYAPGCTVITVCDGEVVEVLSGPEWQREYTKMNFVTGEVRLFEEK